MKNKYLIMIILLGAFQVSNGQGVTPAKQMSIEEANKLNGKVEPTINGIPYSQYKTQQDALKQKQASGNKTVTTQAATQAAPRSVTAQQQPAPVVAAKKAETPVEPTAPSRLAAMKATSNDMPAIIGQQPTTSAAVAEKKAAPGDGQPFADKTIPGTLVPAPGLTISSAADVQPVAAPANTIKMPEQRISQDVKQTPAAPKQGGN